LLPIGSIDNNHRIILLTTALLASINCRQRQLPHMQS